MRTRYLIRFILLSLGFALTTYGLLAWQQVSFELNTFWPMADTFAAHPVHAIVLGLGLIPPTLWEIFILAEKSDKAVSDR